MSTTVRAWLGAVGKQAAVVGAAAAAAVVLGVVVASAAPPVVADLFRPAPLILVVVLVAGTLPFVDAAAGPDPRIRRVLFSALFLKLMSGFLRYYVTFGVYGGAADAPYYDQAGKVIAPQLRLGIWSPSQVEFANRGGGTSNLAFIVGWVYHLLTPDIVVGFVLFSWFGFVGLVLFYRAGVTALPHVDRRRLAVFTMLLPSLLFWPSGLGKDAWIQLTMGLATLGAAQLLAPRVRRSGPFLFLLGIAGAAVVRPHMALLLTAALVAALGLRRATGQWGGVSRISLALGGFALLFVLSSQVERLLGSEVIGGSGPSLVEVSRTSSADGASEFEARPVTNPLQFPFAAVSVIFRPFPVEARSALQLATSIEGTVLLIACVRNRARLRRALRSAFDQPYVLFCLVYSIGFVVAFSNIGNFGILARQRAQLFPFLVVLLALPATAPSGTAVEPEAAHSVA